MEENKVLEEQVEQTEEQQKPTHNYLGFLEKIMPKHSDTFTKLINESVKIEDVVISFACSVNDFIRDVVNKSYWYEKEEKTIDEFELLNGFVNCTFNFLNVISTQNQEFFDNAFKGINIILNDLMEQEYHKIELIYALSEGQTNIPTRYAICLMLLLKEAPAISERDIELAFNFKLKNLK